MWRSKKASVAPSPNNAKNNSPLFKEVRKAFTTGKVPEHLVGYYNSSLKELNTSNIRKFFEIIPKNNSKKKDVLLLTEIDKEYYIFINQAREKIKYPKSTFFNDNEIIDVVGQLSYNPPTYNENNSSNSRKSRKTRRKTRR